MGWKRLLFLTLAAILAVGTVILVRTRLAPHTTSILPERAGAVLSPDRSQGIRIVQQSGVTQVWLDSYAAGSKKLLADLGMGESASNAQWSPDGRLVAFETFDNAGHSPMTTNHVWIVDASSGEIRKLRLPPPNERFSTYLEGWTGADRLRVRTTLLDRPDDVYFVYSYSADELHPSG